MLSYLEFDKHGGGAEMTIDYCFLLIWFVAWHVLKL